MALETSLLSLAKSFGFTPERFGRHYRLKEMDSLIIYNDRTWYRWSKKGKRIGGSQIDFVLEFGTCETVPAAIHFLLNFQGCNISRSDDIRTAATHINTTNKECFILPYKAENYKRTYAYLMQTRGLSLRVVNYFIHDLKILYEDYDHHNLIFIGKDKEGIVRYASKRGTSDIYGIYKGDVSGNDKNYGVNIVNPSNNELKVFEGSIDCMSYIDLFEDYNSNKLVLGMVADNPLVQFLKDYDHIKVITFCLDNDEAGIKAVYGEEEKKDAAGNIIQNKCIGLKEKYELQGYKINIEKPLYGKDFNESLLKQKEVCPVIRNKHKILA